MILTMVDAENRLRVYKYNGAGLEELAALKAASDDPLELAAMAATLALMAGEKNGSTPPAAKKVETKAETKPKPLALPPAPKRYGKKKNPKYAPNLDSVTGRIIAAMAETPGKAFDTHALTEFVDRPPSHISATLSGLFDLDVVRKIDNGEKSMTYVLTRHGVASYERAKALADVGHPD